MRLFALIVTAHSSKFSLRMTYEFFEPLLTVQTGSGRLEVGAVAKRTRWCRSGVGMQKS